MSEETLEIEKQEAPGQKEMSLEDEIFATSEQEPSNDDGPEGDLFDQIIMSANAEEAENNAKEKVEVKDEAEESEAKVVPLYKDLSKEDKEAKVTELETKAETEEGLTDDEIEFMKSEGFEFKTEESKEGVEESEEEKETETPEDNNTVFDSFLEKNLPNETFESSEDKSKKVLELLESEMNANQNLAKYFEDNPLMIDIVKDMQEKGWDFKTALDNNIDVEGLVPEHGTPEYDQYVINQNNLKIQKEKAKEAEQKRIQNQNESAKEALEWVEEKGLSPEDRTKLFSEVDKTVAKLNESSYPKEFLEMFYLKMFHNKIVDKATEKATLDAKNKKIIMLKKNKSNNPTPSLKGGQGQKGKQVKMSPIISEINDAVVRGAKEDNW